MKKEIELLLELQETDLRIDFAKKRKEEIPKELNSLREEIEKTEKYLEDFLNSLKEKELALSNLNVDLEDAQEKVKKYQLQLYQLKSNEEYKAMLRQIEAEKEKIATIEDRMIELMEELEEMKGKKETLRKETGEKKETIQKKMKELESELISLDDEIMLLQEERNRKVSKIDGKLQQTYEKLRKLRGGQVVVAIEGNSCGGCHAELPINMIVELQKEGNLKRCEHCGRLLFWKEN